MNIDSKPASTPAAAGQSLAGPGARARGTATVPDFADLLAAIQKPAPASGEPREAAAPDGASSPSGPAQPADATSDTSGPGSASGARAATRPRGAPDASGAASADGRSAAGQALTDRPDSVGAVSDRAAALASTLDSPVEAAASAVAADVHPARADASPPHPGAAPRRTAIHTAAHDRAGARGHVEPRTGRADVDGVRGAASGSSPLPVPGGHAVAADDTALDTEARTAGTAAPERADPAPQALAPDAAGAAVASATGSAAPAIDADPALPSGTGPAGNPAASAGAANGTVTDSSAAAGEPGAAPAAAAASTAAASTAEPGPSGQASPPAQAGDARMFGPVIHPDASTAELLVATGSPGAAWYAQQARARDAADAVASRSARTGPALAAAAASAALRGAATIDPAPVTGAAAAAAGVAAEPSTGPAAGGVASTLSSLAERLRPLFAGLSGDASPGPSAFAPFAPPAAAASFAQPAATSTAAVYSVGVPVHDPAFPDALSERVTWLIGEGTQNAELTLHPRELGPIRIEVLVADGAASLNFSADNADTRSAIEQSLPRLREMLASAGVQLGGTQVDAGGAQQQAGADTGRPRPARGAGADAALQSRLGALGADETAPSLTLRRGAPGAGRIDVFA